MLRVSIEQAPSWAAPEGEGAEIKSRLYYGQKEEVPAEIRGGGRRDSENARGGRTWRQGQSRAPDAPQTSHVCSKSCRVGNEPQLLPRESLLSSRFVEPSLPLVGRSLCPPRARQQRTASCGQTRGVAAVVVKGLQDGTSGVTFC
ncbi:hypothetical protein NDU88_003458 [Pleurodeles waltl]|uniref:Uncharacterized protein n=1 Tax=Pleurodeles waltl TaxID=8319 RepID=A0AAV7TPU8_PLEWA|nr:hypothetical protein NDU88_003458 [Pleurodeles waltl]